MPDPASAPVAPGFVPKAALFASRTVHKPFHLPKNLTNSALRTGGAATHVSGKAALAAKEGVAVLKPRGPAKWIDGLLNRVIGVSDASDGQAKKSVEVFWGPLSAGSEQIGLAVAGPGAAYYAGKAGFPEPTSAELINQLLHTSGYPVPAPPDDGGSAQNGGSQSGAQAPSGAAPDSPQPPTEQPSGGGEQPQQAVATDGEATPAPTAPPDQNPGVASGDQQQPQVPAEEPTPKPTPTAEPTPAP